MATKEKKKTIEIQDKKEIKKLENFYLPNFIKNKLLKTYKNQGLVYLDEYNNPVPIGEKVKWLEEVSVITTSSKRAHKLTFNHLNKKHPKYKGFIQLF